MVDSEQLKLFVGGISRETTEKTLRDHFSKYGAVVESVITRDRATGCPRGFGFVTFSDSSAITEALNETHVILERTVDVKRAVPRSEQHQNQQQVKGFSRNGRSNNRSNGQFRTKKIFVGGLAPSVTEEEFKTYFEKFGRITDVVVMHDNMTNRPRGFGFITFNSEDAVENVTRKSFHELSGKLVEVKRAVPKEVNSYDNFSSRVGSGRGNFSNYHHGNYPSFPDGYGGFPLYGPFSGYGGPAGYSYGASLYGGGFPTGGYYGVSYEVTHVGPRSPLISPPVFGIRGSLLPYGNASAVYPAYLNSGVGVMGMAVNRFNGISSMEVSKSSESGNGVEQVGVVTSAQINGIESYGVSSNHQNEEADQI